MSKISVDAVAREQGKNAASADSGRAAEAVYGGYEKALRQTAIALTAGKELAEHENPSEATPLALAGRVELVSLDAACGWTPRGPARGPGQPPSDDLDG